MDAPLRVEVELLRGAFNIVLDHVEKVSGPVVDLDKEYFWAVAPDELYDRYERPTELTVGQLSESLGHLKQIEADPERALAYALVWFADVTRAVGHTVIG